MKVLRKLAILSLVTAFFTAGRGFAQPPLITVTVVLANPHDTPLQIRGFKLPEKVHDPLRVVLQNVSPKQTTRFWIEVLIGDPAGKSGAVRAGAKELVGSNSNIPNLEWPEERVISPGSSGEVHETVFNPLHLAFQGSRVLSNCLHVAAVVSRVEFADGTVWEPDFFETRGLWKDSVPKGASSCVHRPQVEPLLRRLEGAGYASPIGTPTKIDTSQRESYSFSCAVRRRGGRLLVICPF